MEDVFAIEDQIAEQVARALRVILKDQAWESGPRLRPSDIRAYEYYLRGQQFLLNPRAKNLGFAREMFDRAIQVDPEYAPAWAGTAEAAALFNMYLPLQDGGAGGCGPSQPGGPEVGPNACRGPCGSRSHPLPHAAVGGSRRSVPEGYRTGPLPLSGSVFPRKGAASRMGGWRRQPRSSRRLPGSGKTTRLPSSRPKPPKPWGGPKRPRSDWRRPSGWWRSTWN